MSVLQNAMDSTVLRTVTTSTGRVVELEKVPEQTKPSAIAEAIKVEDNIVLQEIDVLKSGAVAKQQSFQQRLDELDGLREGIDALIEREVRAREEQDRQVREIFAKTLKALRTQYLANINTRFDRIETESYQPLQQNILKLERQMRDFVDTTVPLVIEEQTGQVVRYMTRAHETFDIDNTKLLKREQKIIERFDMHREDTKDLLAHLEATSVKSLIDMDEDLDLIEREDDRAEESFQCDILRKISELKIRIQVEKEARRAQDKVLVGSFEASIQRLQDACLANYARVSDPAQER